MSAVELDQTVDWHGRRARVVALIEDPAAIIEVADDGRRVTVSQAVLRPVDFAADGVNLDAIEARWNRARDNAAYRDAWASAADVPSLIGEVRRLQLALREA